MKDTTNSIKLYVCDDDSNFLSVIKEKIMQLTKNEFLFRIELFEDSQALLKHCREELPDVLILDIDMPILSGFEVADTIASIKKDILIIYITNYDNTIFQSWHHNPFWFVRKSHINDLDKAIPKLINKLKQQRLSSNEKVILKVVNSVIELDLTQVVYIESLKHDIVIVFKNGKEFAYRCRLSDAENQLKDYGIVRIQRGFLVNLRFVSKVTSREVKLIDAKRFSISRNRVNDVKNKFGIYMRDV